MGTSGVELSVFCSIIFPWAYGDQEEEHGGLSYSE